MATAAVKRYWDRVAALGCLCCGRPATIAHMHGRSLRGRNPAFLKPKGKKMPWGDWLVAPLCEQHAYRFDNATASFEATVMTGAEMVDMTATKLGVDAWGNAEKLLKPGVPA